jgi:hypothetical protein
MTDLEYCDAVVKARKVRDDAILPLLHRVTTESKIRWGNVPALGGLLPEGNDCFVVEVVSDCAESNTFRIWAEITIGKDGQELCHSVLPFTG